MTTIIEQVHEEYATSGEITNEYQGKHLCGCKTSKWGLLAAGALELVTILLITCYITLLYTRTIIDNIHKYSIFNT